MTNDIRNKLIQLAGEENVLCDEPMKNHTTFKIGGPADYFVMPTSIQDLQAVLRFCKEANVPVNLIGNGSNLLVGDKGVRGVVIQLFRNLNEIKLEGSLIEAQAGAMLATVARQALNANLTGLEFAAGIPGTLGGAMIMNAGAYGGEMKDVVESVTLLTADLQVKEVSCEDMQFGYRTSKAAVEGDIILSAKIRLSEGNYDEILAQMNDLREKRTTKQPLDLPSAGSTFKRPVGYFAGKLIQDAGLQGFRVGDAQVSEKHCGFVVNLGEATAKDVTDLMQQVADIVEEKFGVRIEPEVKRIGEFV